MNGRVVAIVVAGGEGRRFGTPKQYALIGGRRVLDWSVEAARTVAGTVVLVVPREAINDPSFHAAADMVVAGGETRSDSVRAGLAAAGDEAEVVVVHDAARPLATAALFRAVVAAVEAGADAAVPALPVTDTVKRVAAGRVLETVDRSDLVAVQTPQAFRLGLLRKAHEAGVVSTDDASLVEALGATVVVVPGEPRNMKLTSPDDLAVLEAWSPQA